MKLKARILSFAVAGLFAAPFSALAQGGTGGLSEDDFSRFDLNRDGTISRSEWHQGRMNMAGQGAGQPQAQDRQQQAQGRQQQGQQREQDRQQQAQREGQWVVVTITPVEQRIMEQQRRESLFRALDANGNGIISPVEAGLNVQLLNAFAKLDQDDNGAISREEFASVHVQDGSQQAQRQGQGAAGGSAGAYDESGSGGTGESR